MTAILRNIERLEALQMSQDSTCIHILVQCNRIVFFLPLLNKGEGSEFQNFSRTSFVHVPLRRRRRNFRLRSER